MKVYMLLFGLFAIMFCSCEQAIDTEKEKAAIMAVLQEEGDAFSASDMNRIASTHTANDLDLRLSWNGSGVERYEGWNEIKSLYEDYLKSRPDGVTSQNSKENAIVRIGNGTAWVVCDNIWKWSQDGNDISSRNVQVAFLEKKDGNWKVNFNAFVPQTDPKSVDGVYEYMAPTRGIGINRNGKFIYLFGGDDTKATMTSNGGNYELVGDSVKNTITYHTDSKQVGTVFWWKIKSWSGDTATYVVMNEKGVQTGGGKALRVTR